MTLDLRHCTDGELPGIRHVLLDVYAEVYAGQLHVPFTSLERFDQRLTNHSRGTGWEAVIGYAGPEPVGYAYAAPLPEDARWWTHMTTPARRFHERDRVTHARPVRVDGAQAVAGHGRRARHS